MNTTLYKFNKAGTKILLWTIEHDEKSYWTTSGQMDGKMTTTAPTFCESKNVGKANETTVSEQVEIEVKSKIKSQLESGYSYEIPTSKPKKFEVTLAEKYTDVVEHNKAQYPYILQPKLDGIRCYIKRDEDGVIRMRSRAHKEFFSVPHIVEDSLIQKIFCLMPDIILDGELYNHELKSDFNKIVSLVRKTKPTQSDLEESKNLIYFACFDCFFQNEENLSYTERNNRLVNFLSNGHSAFLLTREVKKSIDEEHFYKHPIRLVSSAGITGPLLYKNEVAVCDGGVESKIEEYIYQGFEGIMLKSDTPYFFGRTSNLLKYKRFKDAEYEVVDIEDGKGNKKGIGTNVICRAANGTVFKAGINGTEEYATNLFINKNNYIGKICTIKYQELTPLKADGTGEVPRFGKMISIRDYE